MQRKLRGVQCVLAALVSSAVVACGGNSAKNPDGSTNNNPDGSTSTIDGGTPDSGVTSGVDAGPDAAFVQATHPALPLVTDLGGGANVAPQILPIVYDSSDPNSVDVDLFSQEMASTSYWTTTIGEYGSSVPFVNNSVNDPNAQFGSVSDSQLQADLVANTSGNNPAWGTADSNTIYLFAMPPGTQVSNNFGICCQGFDGYHSETTVNAVPVAYAVACACPGFYGAQVTDLQQRTIAMSRELLDTATDPFAQTNPGYAQEDAADIVWTVTTGGEVADLCIHRDDDFIVPAGGSYTVARSWSNAAAKAGKDPCVPSSASFFIGAYPQLSSLSWTPPGQTTSIGTQAVFIALGQSQVVNIGLSSTASTGGPWTVTAVDYNQLINGSTPDLTLSLDKSTGQNGDTLHLTVKVTTKDAALAGEAFFLKSTFGTPGTANYQSTLTAGLVTN